MTLADMDINAVIASFMASVGGGGAALMYMRRRLSRDGSEIAKDRAEVNLVATLQAERDAALEAERAVLKAHTEDARSIERLSASNDYLTRELGQANRELKRLRRLVSRLAPQAEAFMSSAFAPDALASAPSVDEPPSAPAPAAPRLWGRRSDDRIESGSPDIPRRP